MTKRFIYTGDIWTIKNHTLVPNRPSTRVMLNSKEKILHGLVKAGVQKRMDRTSTNLFS